MAKVNETTLQHLRMLEGLPGGKPALTSYRDIAGVWTIFYGHTGMMTTVSPPIKVGPGMSGTAEDAEVILLKDAEIFADGVDRLVKVPLNDNQRGALILFSFNEGLGALQDSTLLRLLNQGNYDSVPAQLARWAYYHDRNGKLQASPGLQSRRATETNLWLTPAIAAPTVPAAAMAETHDSGSAAAPPDVTNVAQTTSGKAGIAAIATGGAAAIVQGIQQAQPVIAATQNAVAMTATLPQWLRLASVAAIVVSVICVAYALWDKHRKVKDPTI
jgi:lysozyme